VSVEHEILEHTGCVGFAFRRHRASEPVDRTAGVGVAKSADFEIRGGARTAELWTRRPGTSSKSFAHGAICAQIHGVGIDNGEGFGNLSVVCGVPEAVTTMLVWTSASPRDERDIDTGILLHIDKLRGRNIEAGRFALNQILTFRESGKMADAVRIGGERASIASAFGDQGNDRVAHAGGVMGSTTRTATSPAFGQHGDESRKREIPGTEIARGCEGRMSAMGYSMVGIGSVTNEKEFQAAVRSGRLERWLLEGAAMMRTIAMFRNRDVPLLTFRE